MLSLMLPFTPPPLPLLLICFPNFSMSVNTTSVDNDGVSNEISEVKKELEETNSDIEGKDKEIVSYKKTIATLTEEVEI